MKALIQRVKRASVEVDGVITGEINQGVLLLLGVEKNDTPELALKLLKKILSYRIFSDSDGKMNLNVQQVQGQLLVVSQFTLVALIHKRVPAQGFLKALAPNWVKACTIFL